LRIAVFWTKKIVDDLLEDEFQKNLKAEFQKNLKASSGAGKQHWNTFLVHAATVRVGGQQLVQEFHSPTLLQTCFTPTLIKMQHHPTATSLTRAT